MLSVCGVVVCSYFLAGRVPLLEKRWLASSVCLVLPPPWAGGPRYSQCGCGSNVAPDICRRRLHRLPQRSETEGWHILGNRDGGRGAHRADFRRHREPVDAQQFSGFSIPDGEAALAPPKQFRQIEFIGDFHTLGFGDISPKREWTPEGAWATTDSSQDFGALTASHYHAEFQLNAIPGHGVVRNYNGGTGEPVPVVYPYCAFR